MCDRLWDLSIYVIYLGSIISIKKWNQTHKQIKILCVSLLEVVKVLEIYN